MSLMNLTYTCLEQIEESLNCAICKEPFKTPVMIGTCSHNFCSICVRRYFTIKLECPICGIDASQINIYPNRALDSMITKFKELREHLMMMIKQYTPDVQTVAPEHFDSELNTIEDTMLEKKSSDIAPSILSPSSHNTSEEETPEFKLSLLVESQSQGFSPILDDKLNVTQLSQPTDSRDMFSETSVKMDDAEIKNNELSSEKLNNDEIIIKKDFDNKIPVTNNKINLQSTSASHIKNDEAVSIYAADCPVCGLEVATSTMNKHLDMCLNREEKKKSLRVKPKRKKMNDTPAITMLVYKLYSVKDLRQKMKKIGLSSSGDKKELSRRHKDFLTKYQAEHDKLLPRDLPALIREFEREELTLKKKKVEMLISAKDVNDPECNVERMKYLKKYSKQYEKLENEAKCRPKLKRKVDESNKTKILDVNQFSTSSVCHSSECASNSPELIYVGPTPSESAKTSSNNLKRKYEEHSESEEVKTLTDAVFMYSE